MSEKAREIAKGLGASLPCDRYLWCDCPSRLTGSLQARDKANEGVAHCLENVEEIATALLAERAKALEEAIEMAEDMMSNAEHRKKIAAMEWHQSEINHQDGRWHAANDFAEALRAIDRRPSPAPSAAPSE